MKVGGRGDHRMERKAGGKEEVKKERIFAPTRAPSRGVCLRQGCPAVKPHVMLLLTTSLLRQLAASTWLKFYKDYLGSQAPLELLRDFWMTICVEFSPT